MTREYLGIPTSGFPKPATETKGKEYWDKWIKENPEQYEFTKELQSCLATHGFYPASKIDGIPGPKLDYAIRLAKKSLELRSSDNKLDKTSTITEDLLAKLRCKDLGGCPQPAEDTYGNTYIPDLTGVFNSSILKPKEGCQNYVIKQDETLWDLAERIADERNISPGNALKAIREANNFDSGDLIYPGQTIYIPDKTTPIKTDKETAEETEETGETKPSSKTHKVKRGETLSEIAAANGTDAETLAKENSIDSSAVIKPGQQLKIPAKKAPPQTQPVDEAPQETKPSEQPEKGQEVTTGEGEETGRTEPQTTTGEDNVTEDAIRGIETQIAEVNKKLKEEVDKNEQVITALKGNRNAISGRTKEEDLARIDEFNRTIKEKEQEIEDLKVAAEARIGNLTEEQKKLYDERAKSSEARAAKIAEGALPSRKDHSSQIEAYQKAEELTAEVVSLRTTANHNIAALKNQIKSADDIIAKKTAEGSTKDDSVIKNAEASKADAEKKIAEQEANLKRADELEAQIPENQKTERIAQQLKASKEPVSQGEAEVPEEGKSEK